MTAPRIVISGGRVRSINDGQWHYISAAQVAHLSGIKPGTWRRGNPDDRHPPGTIHLGPRYRGDYVEAARALGAVE